MFHVEHKAMGGLFAVRGIFLWVKWRTVFFIGVE